MRGSIEVVDGQTGHVALRRRRTRRLAAIRISSMPTRQYFRATRQVPGQVRGFPGVVSADPPQRIGVASHDHHGRRPERHPPVDVLGDVHAQEGQIRVGDGVDHAAQTRCREWASSEVGAAERDDLRVARGAGLAGQAVRHNPAQTMTVRAVIGLRGGVHRGRSGAVDETDRDAVADLDTAGHEFRSDRPGDQGHSRRCRCSG